ncbi:MAG: CHAT domain-containing protein [Oceanicaulis sp.]|uniref:CHAT domain-containing protein n=1 Tax=Glycocaulis sp. TaxID=1969725 RepID=UPI0025C66EF1|nr:CHAT domain-containing protein [Glycocaulis sp.]MCC5982281.1 CHAT domain-containing protein [Oceanicaulis sp.]MCH8520738.1 CHAT domain-containing protein [Glycocaulis sp.]
MLRNSPVRLARALLASAALAGCALSGAAAAQGSTACADGAMSYECLRAEGYWAAQWAIQTSATEALSQVGARFASGDDALGLMVAERRRASDQRAAAERSLYEALALPDAASREAATATARTALDAATTRLSEIDASLARDFPEYVELTSPSPLTVEGTQALLGADEALLLILAGERASFVFVIDQDGIDWARIEVTSAELAEAVNVLRAGLDLDHGRGPWNAVSVQTASAAASLPVFDRAGAYRLYQQLLAPVEARLEGKTHVYAVPSGALSSLPLGLLVTEPPQGVDNDIEALRSTSWLARRFAMTVLPSPASLRSVTRFGASRASEPFLGVGDPCIGVRAGAGCERAARPGGSAHRGGATRGVFGADVTREGVFLADVEAVRALSALPNTRPELVALAEAFGARADRDLLLGDAATEMQLRTMSDLANRRVITFATHGLIADELPGLTEPALVLTPPAEASDIDDGLLTASEIARDLTLDADWVILSACNTAAPGGAGAESLSGLASAFFYAGARALLVSHWVVDDAAARRLTTGTLSAMNANPSAGRAEALRHSMLSMMDDPEFAHPAMWAPFVLVGQNRLAE